MKLSQEQMEAFLEQRADWKVSHSFHVKEKRMRNRVHVAERLCTGKTTRTSHKKRLFECSGREWTGRCIFLRACQIASKLDQRWVGGRDPFARGMVIV